MGNTAVLGSGATFLHVQQGSWLCVAHIICLVLPIHPFAHYGTFRTSAAVTGIGVDSPVHLCDIHTDSGVLGLHQMGE